MNNDPIKAVIFNYLMPFVIVVTTLQILLIAARMPAIAQPTLQTAEGASIVESQGISDPHITATVGDVMMGYQEVDEVALNDVFNTPVGDELSYSVSGRNSRIVSESVSDGVTLAESDLAARLALIAGSPTDTRGRKATVNGDFTVARNDPPTVTKPIGNHTIGRKGKFSVDLTTIFSDPDDDDLRYRVWYDDAYDHLISVLVFEGRMTVTGDNVGTAIIRVTAEDASNPPAETTFSLTILSNYAPTVKKLLWTQRMDITNTYTEDLTTVFTDRDGDALTYSAESGDDQVATVVVSNNTVTVTAVGEGRTKIIVSATDEGGSDTKTDEDFNVIVSSNHDPTITNPIEDQTLGIDGTFSVDLNTVFNDADDDVIYFNAYTAHSVEVGLEILNNTLTVTGRSAGKARVLVTGGDAVGQTINWVTDEFFVTVLDNHVPTIANRIDDQTIRVGGTYSVDLTTVFSDADDDDLRFTASSGAINKATVAIANNVLTVTGVAVGSAGIKLTATDENGSNTTVEYNFTVTVESGPNVDNPIADLTIATFKEYFVDLDTVFTDPEGGRLTYSAVAADASIADVSVTGSIFRLYAHHKWESTDITVTAEDVNRASISDEFRVTVVEPVPTTAPTNVRLTPGDDDLTVEWDWMDKTNVCVIPDGDIRSGFEIQYKKSTESDWLEAHESATTKNSVDQGVFEFRNPGSTRRFVIDENAVGRDPRVGNQNGVALDAVSYDVRILAYSAPCEDDLIHEPNSNYSDPIPSATVGNEAPTAVAIRDTTVAPNSTVDVDLSGVFSDPNGDPLTLSASSGDESVATVVYNQDDNKLTVTGEAAGSALITVTATDQGQLSVDATFTVIVNTAPQVASPIGDLTMGRFKEYMVDLNEVFNDPDGDVLEFSAVSDNAGVVTVSVSVVDSDTLLTVISGDPLGSRNITVTASDGKESVEHKFSVSVQPRVKTSAPKNVSLVPGADELTVNWEWEDDTGVCDVTGPNSGFEIEYKKSHTGVDWLQAWESSSVKNSVERGVFQFHNPGSTRQFVIDENAKGLEEHDHQSGVALDAVSYDVRILAYSAPCEQSILHDPNSNYSHPVVSAIVGNEKPIVVKAIRDTTVAPNSTVDVDLAGVFSDPNGDPLTLTASSGDESKATVVYNQDDNKLIVTGKAGGSALITVTATDPGQLSVDATFTVRVNNPPTVANGIADQTIGITGTFSIDLTTVFSDPENDDLTFEATSGDESKATVAILNNTLTVTGEATGSAIITVSATDAQGSKTSVSDNFTITVTSNHAPVVANEITDKSVAVGSTITVALGNVFSDADGDALTYTASSSDGAKASVSVSGNTLTVTGEAQGSATVTVTATDPDGAQATDAFVVSVTTSTDVNNPPEVANAIADKSVAVNSDITVALGNVFSDPDGDALTYTASSSDGAKASVSVSGNTLTVTGEAQGSATVTVTATDPDGAQATDAFVVSVTTSTDVNNPPEVANAIADKSVAVNSDITVALGNVFSDPDGDALTYTASSSDGAKASVSVSGNTLTVTGEAQGSATVTVTATDPDGAQATDAFVVSVTTSTDVNNPPEVANAIADKSVAVNSDITVALGNVFSDPDGDALTYTASSSDGAKASVSVSGNTLTVTGEAQGSATVTVTATDPDGAQATDAFVVSVTTSTDVNNPPEVANAIADKSVAVNSDITVALGNVFSDPDGDALTYTASSSDGAKASVSVSGNTLTVTGEAQGSATVTVTATDPDGAQATDAFVVSVTTSTDVNNPPEVANAIADKSVAVNSDITVALGNVFSDPDGDALTYTASSSDGAKASVSVSGNTLTVTGEAQGSATVTVTATDPDGAQATDAFVVSVTTSTDVNNPPEVANAIADKSVAVNSDITVALGNVFSDPDGDALTYTASSSDGAKASVSVSGNTLTVTGEAQGSATVTVTATDPDGAQATDAFVVSVTTSTDVNNPPEVANAIADKSVAVNSDITVALGNVFSDPDGDALTYTASSSDGAKASVSVSGNTLTVTGEAQGSATVTVTATDPDGAQATDAFVVSVTTSTDVNNPPEVANAIADKSVAVNSDITVALGNVFSDPDGDALTYTASSSDGAKASVSVSGNTLTVTGEAQGSATVTVTATDPDGAQATDAFVVSVTTSTDVNNPPEVANAIADKSVAVNSDITVALGNVFSDPDGDALTYTASSSDGAKASVSVSGNTLTVTGEAQGSATVTVTATDPDGAQATDAFVVSVTTSTDVNNPPEVANAIADKSVAVNSDITVALGNVFSDPDGDALTYTASSSDGAKASVSVSGNTLTVTGEAQGSATVTVTATDPDGAQATDAFVVSVTTSTDVNNPPEVANAIADKSVAVNSDITVALGNVFSDPDGDALTYTASSSDGAKASVSVSGNTLTVTGEAQGSATVTVTATDPDGAQATDAFVVSVTTSTDVNNPPEVANAIADKSVAVNSDITVALGNVFSDPDGDALTYTASSSDGAKASVSVSGNTLTVTGEAQGSATVTVTATDPDGAQATDAFVVSVTTSTDVNNPPEVANAIADKSVAVNSDITVALGNVFSDPDGDALTYTASSSDGAKASVSVSGNTLTVTGEAQGSATVTVTATDPDGAQATDAFVVSVTTSTDVNNPPEVANAIADKSVAVNSDITVALGNVFSDPDGDALTYTASSSDGAKASVSVSGNTLTVTGEAQGSATVTVTATDPDGAQATDAFVVSVTTSTDVNNPPEVANAIADKSVAVNSDITVALGNVFSDPDGDALTYTASSSDGAKASVSVSGNTLTVTGEAQGSATVTVTATDPDGAQATDAFVVSVTTSTDVNNPPEVANAIADKSVAVNSDITVALGNVFSDPDGDALTYTASSSDGAKASVSVSGNTLTVTGEAQGSATVTVTATDPDGAQATDAFVVSVTTSTDVNNPPEVANAIADKSVAVNSDITVALGNVFSDPDGDALTYTASSSDGAKASVSVSGNTLTVTGEAQGSATVTVTATDPDGAQATDAFVVSVTTSTDVNNPPEVANAIADKSVAVNSDITVALGNVFSDPDGDALTYTASSSDGAKASVSVSGNTLTVTGEAQGSATVTVTATDPDGAQATDAFVVSVTTSTDVNNPPEVANAIADKSVAVNSDITVALGNVFSDPDGDALTYTASSSDGAKASVSVSGNTLTVTGEAQGSATVTVTATDPDGAQATDAFVVSVTTSTDVNNPPEVANAIADKSVAVNSDITVALGNVFSDPDGDALTYTASSSDGAKASVSVSGNTLTVTGEAQGSATVTVTATDPDGAQATDAFVVSVTTSTDVNNPPEVANAIADKSVAVNSDITVALGNVFSDPDGDALTYTASSSDGAKASVSVSGNTLTVTGEAQGSATVTVTATDPDGAQATDAFVVSVTTSTDVNNPPEVANAIADKSVAVNSDITVALGNVFSDPDGDALTYTASSSDGAKASVSVSGNTLTVTGEAQGSATVTVTATDPDGAQATDAFVVSVTTSTDVNNPPEVANAIADKSVAVNSDITVALGNVFSDPDGDALTYTASSSDGAKASVSVSGNTLTVTGEAQGSATVTVTATDPDGAQATDAFVVSVTTSTDVNNPPEVANAIADKSVAVNSDITVALGNVFSDPDGDALTYTASSSDGAKASVSVSGNTLTVTGEAQGSATVTVTATDPDGAQATDAFVVSVTTSTDVNNPPEVANAIADKSVAVNSDITVALGNVFSDPDGDALTYTASSSDGAKASVSVSGNTLTVTGEAQGSATVTVTATDPDGAQATDAFVVSVTTSTDVNNPPEVANAIADKSVAVNSDITVALGNVFSDPDGDALTYTASSSDGAKASVSVSGNTLTVTGEAQGSATVTVTATDPDGAQATDAFVVSVTTSTDVNNPPEVANAIADKSVAVNSDITVALGNVFSDPDGDALTYTASSSDGAKASVSVSGNTLTVTGEAQGSATVTVTATDPDGAQATDAFVVSVTTSTDVNNPPEVANAIADKSVAVNSDITVALGNVFSDPDGDALTYTASSSDGAKASVSVSGNTLTVTGEAQGSATVTVTATDPDGAQATDAFVVSVTTSTDVNNPPEVANAIADKSVAVNSDITVALGNVFSDPDGDALTYTASSSDGAKASVSVSGNTLTVTGEAQGSATVTVTATDPDGAQATDAFVVSVTTSTDVNNPPEVANAIADKSVAVNSDITVALGNVFSDPDGDALTYTASSSDGAKASVSVSGNTLTVTGEAQGSATVTVTATDPDGAQATDAFVVSVTTSTDVNNPPEVANAIADKSVAVNSDITVALGNVFSDPDGDALTYTASSSDGAKASVSVSGNTLTVTGEAQGSATVTVTATDPDGAQATDAFVVSVTTSTDVNNPPEVANAIADKSVAVNSDITVALGNVFSDPDGDALTYTASSSDGAKASVSVSGNTLTVTGEAQGSATVTVTATDPDGAQATDAFVVSVTTSTDVNNPPEVANAIADKSVAVNSDITVALGNVFSDPDGDALTYTASSSDGAKASVSVSGNTLTVTGEAQGSATVTVTATDPDGAQATDAFVVSVTTSTDVNNPPEVANAISNYALAAGADVAIDLSNVFSDPDGDNLTFTASSADIDTATVAVSESTLTLTGIAEGRTTIEVTAEDPGGLSVTTSFNVAVTRGGTGGGTGGGGGGGGDEPTAPGLPASLTATAGDRQVQLSWNPPSSDGGSPVTDYEYRFAEGPTIPQTTDWTSVGVITSTTINDLTNGQLYTFEVRARNDEGAGDPLSTSATPGATPSAPIDLIATAGNRQVQLDWDPPSSDGGSPVIGFEYRYAEGSTIPQNTNWTSVGIITSATITNLTNGQLYTFEVRAENTLGFGSPVSASATPGATPSAPIDLIATAGNSQVQLNWSPPSSDGGSPVKDYQYRFAEGSTIPQNTNWTSVGTLTSATITNLSNGQLYTFEVQALNDFGPGSPSSVSATPSTTPSAPASLTADNGNGQVELTWSAPTSDGGLSISGYEYRYAEGSSVPDDKSWNDVGLVESITIDELTNGQLYTFEVRARNDIGAGSPKRTSATPVGVPTAPSSVTVIAGNGQVILSWEAPSDDGGESITGYEYRYAEGSAIPDDTPWISVSTSRSITITDLTNGQLYTFEVRALNGAGPGNRESVSTTPATVPDAPISLTADAENGQVDLAWSEPLDDGGSSIDRYQYRFAEGDVVPSDNQWFDTGADTRSVTIEGLTNGQIYAFEVRAHNDVGGGEVATATALPLQLQAELYGTQGGEGESATIGVRRNGGVDFPAHAFVRVSDSAFPNVDATEEGRSDGLGRHELKFEGGEAEATITVPVSFDGERAQDRVLSAVIDSAATNVDGVLRPIDFSTNVLELQIDEGDAGLSVADAELHNGAKMLGFVVSMDRSRDVAVTVDYASEDGSARAGEDYVAVSGTVTLQAGETSTMVEVEVLPAPHLTDVRMLTLKLSNATNAVIDDALATGSIARGSDLAKVWLAKFGRTASDHVAQQIARRVEGTEHNSQLTMAGRRMDHLLTGNIGLGNSISTISTRSLALTATSRLTGLAQGTHYQDSYGDASLPHLGLELPNFRDALRNTSFNFVGGSSTGDQSSARRSWSVWGSTTNTNLSGGADNLALDGSVLTATAGMDRQWDWFMLGLAVARSVGESSYGENAGTVNSTLTGVHPYLSLRLAKRLQLWGATGWGRGMLGITPTLGAALETELTNMMAVAGGRVVLRAAREAGSSFELAIRSDMLWTSTTSEKEGTFPEATGQTRRGRAVLVGGGNISGLGGVVRPTLEAGVRQDQGDAENGVGFEVGGGLSWMAGGLSLQVNGRMQLAFEDDSYEEWGYGGSLTYQGRSDGRGPQMRVGYNNGAAASNVRQLWSMQNFSGFAPQNGMPLLRQSDAEFGFGIGEKVLWYPYVIADASGRKRMGIKVSSHQWLRVGLEFGVMPIRTESAAYTPSEIIALRGEISL